MAVNRADPVHESEMEFIDSLHRLTLKHGDLILLERGDSFRSIPDEILRRLVSLCSKGAVGLYFYPAKDLATNMFDAAIYHWVSPYDIPYDMGATYFFLDGKLLGKGKPGFTAMVNDVQSRKPIQPLFLGCHVKDESKSGLTAPFLEYEEILEKALGSKRIILTDMTQF